MSKIEKTVEIHRGLKGVYLDRSAATFIHGRAGELRYRGYSIHDLAAHSNFEETAYLLLKGELPTQSELDAFDAELKAWRHLPEPIYDVIRTVKDAHPMDALRTPMDALRTPMDALRTVVSALAAFEPEVADKPPEATLRKGIRLTSQVPPPIDERG